MNTMIIKKLSALLSVIACTAFVCSCASNEPKKDNDPTREKAKAAYDKLEAEE
ncbi:MAG: hypothetical protein MJZ26_14020 [Fibrobacter sp.]|nr:hypothetical protein [Fibrobacter sp.]